MQPPGRDPHPGIQVVTALVDQGDVPGERLGRCLEAKHVQVKLQVVIRADALDVA